MKSAYEWTLLLISLSLIVQTLEYLSLRKHFTEHGIWRWSEIRSEYSFLKVFDIFLSEAPFLILLVVRLTCSILLLFSFSFTVLLILFLSTLLISLRFRGSFNGGSDYMTSIALFALCTAAFFKTDKVMTGAMWYIALQSILSYFFAGRVKIKQTLWRSGEALTNFIHSPNYNTPVMIKVILKKKEVALLCAWLVMIGELIFPLALYSKTCALFFIISAFLFHLNNTWLFGLNRFLLAWSATYPALYFVANRLSNSP